MNHREIVLLAFDKFQKENGIASGNLLDVGCRDMGLREEFKNRGFEWNGLDPLPSSHGVTVGKMEQMPFHEEKFDLIFCCHAFEHCEDPIRALREFKRVLKHKGWLFIATPYPNMHHILQADQDHIFCLNQMQFTRLLKYVGLEGFVFEQREGIDREDNYNIITIARKV